MVRLVDGDSDRVLTPEDCVLNPERDAARR